MTAEDLGTATRRRAILDLLWNSLSADPENKDRVRTGWGTKRQEGLVACIENIMGDKFVFVLEDTMFIFVSIHHTLAGAIAAFIRHNRVKDEHNIIVDKVDDGWFIYSRKEPGIKWSIYKEEIQE